MDRLLERARWAVFAVGADDRRRQRYARWLAIVRHRQVTRRRFAAAELRSPPDVLDPKVGYLVVSPDGSWDMDGVTRQVRELADSVPTTEEQDRPDKPYLLDLSLDVLAPDSPLARLALHRDVVSTATSYLGMVPLLAGVTVLRSPYVVGPPTGSQLFHSDWEDVKQVKLFVHCSDVTERNGPLTAVRADASARVKRALHYRYGGKEFRRADEEVLPLVEPNEVCAFDGPPGTAVFIDTSACLHYGSRVASGAADRLMVQLQFLRPTAFDLVLRRRQLPTIAGTRFSEAWAALVASASTR